MKLSVIIPIYNTEKYLEECVESLYIQGLALEDFEILIIDDGSTDSSLELAKNLAEQHKNIRVFHQENQGQAIARNKGIDEAQGEYLMFVDSDDYILPGKLSELLQIVEEKDLDTIIYNLQIEQKNGSLISHKIPDVDYMEVFTGNEVAVRYFVFGSMCRGIFSRQIFKKNNLQFKTGFTHEDSELCFRLYPCLKRVLFVDEDVYFYRYNSSSTDRSRDKNKLLRNIESDAILVSKLYEELNKNRYSNEIQMRYNELAISMMIGFFSRIKSTKIWKEEEINTKIYWLKEIGVYPLKYNSSIKSTILSVLLNKKYFLKIYLTT